MSLTYNCTVETHTVSGDSASIVRPMPTHCTRVDLLRDICRTRDRALSNQLILIAFVGSTILLDPFEPGRRGGDEADDLDEFEYER
jgi:hypothetical protein